MEKVITEGFVTDVTQLKRMEEEKGQLERQLLQAETGDDRTAHR